MPRGESSIETKVFRPGTKDTASQCFSFLEMAGWGETSSLSLLVRSCSLPTSSSAVLSPSSPLDHHRLSRSPPNARLPQPSKGACLKEHACPGLASPRAQSPALPKGSIPLKAPPLPRNPGPLPARDLALFSKPRPAEPGPSPRGAKHPCNRHSEPHPLLRATRKGRRDW